MVGETTLDGGTGAIGEELDERHRELMQQGALVEAQRLLSRTKYDLEMLREVGYCNGIENYSRHLTGRKAGEEALRRGEMELQAAVELAESQRKELWAIVENISHSVICTDGAGNRQWMNPAALHLHGTKDEAARSLEAMAKVLRYTAPDGSPVYPDQWPVRRALT